MDSHLLAIEDGVKGPDGFLDDLSVALKTEKGLFVLLGCAHRGPVNIIRHLMKITGEQKVYGVAGGLHLGKATERRIENTVDFLKGVGVHKVACSHCTGADAMSVLRREFDTGYIGNHSGTRVFFIFFGMVAPN